jgi:hypothetical protein
MPSRAKQAVFAQRICAVSGLIIHSGDRRQSQAVNSMDDLKSVFTFDIQGERKTSKQVSDVQTAE